MTVHKMIQYFLTLALLLACDEASALTTQEAEPNFIRPQVTSHISIQMNMPRQNPQGSAIGVPLFIQDNTGTPRYVFSTWYHQICTQDENIWTLKVTCRDTGSIQKEDVFGESYGGQTPLAISFDTEGNPLSFDGQTIAPALFIRWHQRAVGTPFQRITLDLSRVTSQEGPYQHPRIDYNLRN